jgi:hypothetical protein
MNLIGGQSKKLQICFMPFYSFLKVDWEIKNGFTYIALLRPRTEQIMKCLIIAEIKSMYILTIYGMRYVVEKSAEQWHLFKKWLFCHFHREHQPPHKNIDTAFLFVSIYQMIKTVSSLIFHVAWASQQTGNRFPLHAMFVPQ